MNRDPESIPRLVRAAVTVVAFVPPLAIGSVPVTPVVRGRPVALVSVIAVGVSRLGDVREGLLARTTAPVPVVVAAEIDVPLPCRMPVTVVDMVMAGVVVGLATVPAKPLAVATETDVTVPPLTVGVVQVMAVAPPPCEVRTCPAVPGVVGILKL
jgi:hypothetical protein